MGENKKGFRLDKIPRDPNDMDLNLFPRSFVTFYDGITVLVGCNGAGKSSLIRCIKERCRKDHIPCIKIDDRATGGSHMISSLDYYHKYEELGSYMGSSEGERIVYDIGTFLTTIGHFSRTRTIVQSLFSSESYDNCEHVFIILDSSDSGLSIDNVLEIKDVFNNLVIPDIKKAFPENKGVYVIIAANEYEMADGEDCLDVQTFKHLRFKNYDEFKAEILESRKRKDKLLGIGEEDSEHNS